MGRPRKYTHRTKVLSDGRTAFYARFTDQHRQRQELLLGYNLKPAELERKMRDIQHDVEHGTWRAPRAQAIAPDTNPTFHFFASDWYHERTAQGFDERTLEHFRWALGHLLPYFAELRMRDLTLQHVDQYRRLKLLQTWPSNPNAPIEYERGGKLVRSRVGARAGKKRLSPKSVNRTIEVLAQICEAGVDAGYFVANPASSKRRKAKVSDSTRKGNWLGYDQLIALLDAAHLLDTVPYPELKARYGERVPVVRTLNLGRRAFLASMYLCGQRVSESCAQQRKHVSWEQASLEVADGKTRSSVRYTPLLSLAFEVMREWWERAPDKRPTSPLFPNSDGGHRTRDNARKAVLFPAVALADILLEERGQNPMPSSAHTHDGRRTAANWMAAADYDELKMMRWLGHSTARLTIEVYRNADGRADEERIQAAMAEVPAEMRRHLRRVA